MKGLVICQFAITSKNMITKIKQYAQQKENLEVECASVSEISEINFEDYDVVLLAPQIRHYLKNVEDKCKPLGIPVSSIDVVAYGLSDAQKVLTQMEKLYETKK